MSEPCKPGLVYNSPLNHEALRTLTSDGRCPVCDPAVPREEYYAILKRIVTEPLVREAVTPKTRPPP